MSKELKHLLNKVKESTDLSQLQIAKELDIHPKVLSDAVNGRKSDAYVENLINRIKERFIGIDYLAIPQEGLPFFDEEIVTGGGLQGESSPMLRDNAVEFVRLPYLNIKEGDFAVQVHGRSMIDTEHPELSINDGAIVCLRPWDVGYIEWGERYAVATRQGYSVKFLVPSDKEDCIKCVPANTQEHFAPYYINKEEVLGIAKVTAIINMQIL